MKLDAHKLPISLSDSEIHAVENEKEEYKLLGKFVRTRGLKLFSYNATRDELSELNPGHKEVVKLTPTLLGLTVLDVAHEEVTVDSREIQFEALNYDTACKRIEKFKAGKITDLCNLRKPGKIEIL